MAEKFQVLSRWTTSLILISLATYGGQGTQAADTNLTFMLIISGGQFGFNSSGSIPAAEMALEDINETPDVLPGYNLVYDSIRDSQCHRGISLDTFFNGILSDPVKLAVVGCGCSVATEPVAEISYHWNISQISSSSGSPALSNRTRFRNYFRNSPTSDIITPTLRSIAVHFNWSRIAFLTQDEDLYTIAALLFRNELETVNITAAIRTFKTGDNPIETEDLFVESEDYRVFMINAYSGPAKKIICEGFKRNYTYPKYAWITYHWYPHQWWTQNVTNVDVDCTDEELEGFLDRVLSLQRYETLDGDNTTTDIGITLGDFENEFERRATEGRYHIIDVRFRIYDSLWSLAFALNRTMTMVETADISETNCSSMEGTLVPLHQFNYSNSLMGCLITWNLQRTNFSGVSGQVVFDENGTRIQTRTTLFQYRLRGNSLKSERIAYLEMSENYKLTLTPGLTEAHVYPDGTPPDGSPLLVTNTFSTGLVVVFYFLTTIGIGFAIGCFLFNLIFRSRKLIKISSPKLNYFIIAGAMFMYASIYFYLLPVTRIALVQARCIIEHWLFIIGYSLVFGTVLAKMWRVYQIFHNPRLNKKVLQDWQLVLLILLTTGIALLLLFLEATIPHLRGSVIPESDLEHPYGRTSLNVSIEFYVMVCYEASSPSFFWQIFMFIYLAVLQIVGIVLAFQTRRVKLQGLRDSKYIAAIIYISSIVLVVVALVTFSLRSYINIGTGLVVTGIFLLTTIILSLIFVPKMIVLYKDPDGKSVKVTSSPVQLPSSSKNISVENNTNNDGKVVLLETRLKEKDNKITELTLEIEKLKEKVFPCEVFANGTAEANGNT